MFSYIYLSIKGSPAQSTSRCPLFERVCIPTAATTRITTFHHLPYVAPATFPAAQQRSRRVMRITHDDACLALINTSPLFFWSAASPNTTPKEGDVHIPRALSPSLEPHHDIEAVEIRPLPISPPTLSLK